MAGFAQQDSFEQVRVTTLSTGGASSASNTPSATFTIRAGGVYGDLTYLGKGAFGVVVSAKLSLAEGRQEGVAIKKTDLSTDVLFDHRHKGTFSNPLRMSYREMHILRHLCRQDFSDPKIFKKDDTVELFLVSADEGNDEWVPCRVEDVDIDKKEATLLQLQRGAEETTHTNVKFKDIRFSRSPYIISILDAYSPQHRNSAGDILTDLYITMDRMECDLDMFLKREGTLSTDRIRYMMYQLMAGMKYFQSAHVIHRDLKPANILWKTGDRLKFCDFGMSRVMDETILPPEERCRNMQDIATQNVISRPWRAPEMFLFTSLIKPYTNKVDNWSIGCIFAELLMLQEENYTSAAPICYDCGMNNLLQKDLIGDLVAKYCPTINRQDVSKAKKTIIAKWNLQRSKYSLITKKYLEEERLSGSSIFEDLSFELSPEDMESIESLLKVAHPTEVGESEIKRARLRHNSLLGPNRFPELCVGCATRKHRGNGYKYSKGGNLTYNSCFQRAFLQGTGDVADFDDPYNQFMVNLQASGAPGNATVDKYFKTDRLTNSLKLLTNGRHPRSACPTKLVFREVFPEADPNALALLEGLLEFDPENRIEAIAALDSPFLARCAERNPFTEYEYAGRHLLEVIDRKMDEGRGSAPSSMYATAQERSDMKDTFDRLMSLIKKDLNIYNKKFGRAESSESELSSELSVSASSAGGSGGSTNP